MPTGHVVSIFTAPAPAATPCHVSSALAVPGRGLQGDRYFQGSGTFSKPAADTFTNELTLIESEAILAIERDYDIKLDPALARRNILTGGVALNHLVGKTFLVGPVRCLGIKLCEPCGHLEKLTFPGVRNALTHRGGLRARILIEGFVSVGDVITTLPSTSST